jgi:hypothetical protein
VELFVGDVEPDAGSHAETARLIEEYKKLPDYPRKARSAEQILAALGIKAPDYGVPDAESLIEHWQKCVADLAGPDLGTANGRSVKTTEIDANSGHPYQKEKPNRG